jgi:hypothetical protein
MKMGCWTIAPLWFSLLCGVGGATAGAGDSSCDARLTWLLSITLGLCMLAALPLGGRQARRPQI